MDNSTAVSQCYYVPEASQNRFARISRKRPDWMCPGYILMLHSNSGLFDKYIDHRILRLITSCRRFYGWGSLMFRSCSLRFTLLDTVSQGPFIFGLAAAVLKLAIM
jgi:hypothetical protein